jgi:general secretion pathway protein I
VSAAGPPQGVNAPSGCSAVHEGPKVPEGVGAAEKGFTLIEVLVALAIVAIALAAGLQATTALTNNALRQSSMLLAQICAENELVKARLSRQMPGIGDSTLSCAQGGRSFAVTVSVLPTPNPSFRRVDAQVLDGETPVLRLSTIVGKI